MVSKTRIDKVWQKGKPVRGKNENLWRRDDKGNALYKPAYGTQGEHGWEIDHKKPESKGGSDALVNLRPLKTEANRKKSDKLR